MDVVEYASIVSAMAVLASTLAGTFGQKLAVLPTSTASAISSVSVGAKAQHVPPAQARAAYKRAPYSKPVLKYLYAVGWIGGKKSAVSCLFARVSARADRAGDARRDPEEQEALAAARQART